MNGFARMCEAENPFRIRNRWKVFRQCGCECGRCSFLTGWNACHRTGTCMASLPNESSCGPANESHLALPQCTDTVKVEKISTPGLLFFSARWPHLVISRNSSMCYCKTCDNTACTLRAESLPLGEAGGQSLCSQGTLDDERVAL